MEWPHESFFEDKEVMALLSMITKCDDPMPIILVKEFEVDSMVMGFHVYRKTWNQKVGEVYNTRMEPENKEDKYAVAVLDKEGRVVGHTPKGKSGKYAMTVCFYLRSDALNFCSVKVTGRAVNLGDACPL